MRAPAFQPPAFTAAAMSGSLLTRVSMSFFLKGNCHFVPGPTSTTFGSTAASFSRRRRRGLSSVGLPESIFHKHTGPRIGCVYAGLKIGPQTQSSYRLGLSARCKKGSLQEVEQPL